MTNLPINPVEVQSKVALTIRKMIVVAVLIAIAVVLLAANEYRKGPIAWCFEDRDVCTLKAMDQERIARDNYNAELDKQKIDNNTYHNNKINTMKSTLTGETISNELKAGRKENVPEGILGFRIVPQVMASEFDPDIALGLPSWSPDNTRYVKILTEVGSPYVNTPIELYCREAGIETYQCDILVAIANSESNSGLNFKSNFLSRDQAIVLGQTFYYNPVGIKDFADDGKKKNPDENGMYLRKFESWDAFWKFYPAHMKEKYFDRGGNTLETISKCYVSGDCSTVKYSWVVRSREFINKI